MASSTHPIAAIPVGIGFIVGMAVLAMRPAFPVGDYARISVTAPDVLFARYGFQMFRVNAATMGAGWTTGAFRGIMARMIYLAPWRNWANKSDIGRPMRTTDLSSKGAITELVKSASPLPTSILKNAYVSKDAHPK